jgi:Family of unknown function (DUF6491)
MTRAMASGLICALLAGSLAACSTPAAGNEAASASIADSCINPTRITKQEILSDQEIQFTLGNGEVWLNRLPRTCPSLKFQGGFTWEVRGTLVCSNEETIYVREDGTPCQLGVFTRVANGA